MKTYVFISGLTLWAATSFAQPNPTYIPTEGLVGWWPFTGNADDMSGNENNGTVYGASLTTDRFGASENAYSFNKQDGDYIEVYHSQLLDSMPSMTITFWTNINDYSGFNHVASKTNLTDHQFIFSNNGYGLFYYYDGGSNFFQSDTLPLAGVWNHIAVTYDWTGNPNESKCYFYLNGEITDTFEVSQPLTETDFQLYFGSLPGYPQMTVDGKADDIGIWNRALTNAEILQVFQAAVIGVESYKSERFNIYPNPATDFIHINSFAENPNSNYKIYDYSSRVVLSGKLNNTFTKIDLTSFSRGVYFIQFGKGHKEFVKLIKN